MHILGFKRYCSEEHRIQDNSCTPYIRLKALIPFAREYFGSYVGRSATLILHDQVFVLHYFAHAKVANLHVTLRSEQNVVKLNIPMEDSLTMHIFKSIYYLSKNEFSLIFIQLSSSTHKGKKVSSTTDLHHIDNMTINFKALIQSYNILMSRSFQYIILLPYFLQ